jgi:hypothetical protein
MNWQLLHKTSEADQLIYAVGDHQTACGRAASPLFNMAFTSLNAFLQSPA